YGCRPVSRSRSEPAPCQTAGSHHGASSRGTTPSATAGGAHTSRPWGRDRVTAYATTRTTTARAVANTQATGANAVQTDSSSPDRQAARQRRSTSGSAKPSAACASQGRAVAATTTPSRPLPQAPDVTGTSA